MLSDLKLSISCDHERMHACSGVQLAKMTPFRSFVVTMSMAVVPVAVYGYSLHIEGGLATYANVRMH